MPGTLQAGEDFAVLNPKTWWAPIGSVLPSLALPYDSVWPSPWKKISDTVNGLQFTCRNPRTAITSEERGRIGDVPTGDDGVSVAFQVRTPSMDLVQIISGLTGVATPATAEVDTLTVTGGATAAGNVSVTLGGATTAVAVLATDTAAQVATKIRSAVYVGWTATGVDPDVVFTASAPGIKAAPAFSAGGTGVTATFAVTAMGTLAHNSRYVNKRNAPKLMLGVEGFAIAGSLFDVDTMIRAIVYRGSNTANSDHVFRSGGADGLFNPTATLEALPAQIAASQIAGTGISLAELDPNGKFNYFDLAAA